MINKISSGMQSTQMLKTQQKVANYQTPAMTKPQHDSVSFGGAAKFASAEGLSKAIEAAKQVIGKNGAEASKLVSSAVQEVMSGKAGEAVSKLTKNDSKLVPVLQTVASDAKNLVRGVEPDKVTAKAMEIVNANIGELQGGKFLRSKGLHKVLDMANSNQAVFDALFALGLAGVLRPATIYALPTKNKDDNAYAAGHSISSGLIGFGMSLLINAPIANAMKNVKNNPKQYLKNDTIKKLGKIAKDPITGNAALAGKNFDIATRYVNMLPKIAFAIPQACLTVALVPVMLKNVFGIEKGKSKKTAEPAPQVAKNTHQKDEKKISFGGAPVDGKKVGVIKNALSKVVAGVLNNKTAQKIVDKTAKSDVNIVKHLSALNGMIISGMYVVRTLKNDKLDPERKSTLAVNQATVSIVSTVLGYFFDAKANKKIDKLAQKFQAANFDKAPAKLAECTNGIKAATSMMIFGLVYRYISPVLVTPIANKIGNAINAHKHAKAEQTQKA
jgi:hypothetical protein